MDQATTHETTTRIGLFGIGLDPYWPHFPELKQRLEGYLATVHSKLAGDSVDVVNLGLVDTVPNAFVADHAFRREVVDLIFFTSPARRCQLPCCQSFNGLKFR